MHKNANPITAFNNNQSIHEGTIHKKPSIKQTVTRNKKDWVWRVGGGWSCMVLVGDSLWGYILGRSATPLFVWLFVVVARWAVYCSVSGLSSSTRKIPTECEDAPLIFKSLRKPFQKCYTTLVCLVFIPNMWYAGCSIASWQNEWDLWLLTESPSKKKETVQCIMTI